MKFRNQSRRLLSADSGSCSFLVWRSIHDFLGPSLDLTYREQSDIVDNYGLKNLTSTPQMHHRQFIAAEADVARDFEDFIRPVRSAFPFMWARSQSTRPGPNSGPIFVDYQLTWPGTGDPRLERAVIIGDFKKPGTLKPEEWADLDGNVSEGTK
jgi:hypothetical protein